MLPERNGLYAGSVGTSERGIVIINVTQCSAGMVEMERYETGYQLLQAGVVSGYDSTTESAVTKLMFLLGHGYTPDEVRDRMNRSIAGDNSVGFIYFY